jgi:predicted Fe-Mo cluster-binding NifX family protein
MFGTFLGLERGMRERAHQQERQEIIRIAVPYYGTLSLPRSGLSRVYFVADVNLSRRLISELALKVWDPKNEPNLFSWLNQEQVNGIICSDSSCQYEVALQSEGIWAMWGCTGEVSEMIDQWLKREGLPPVEGEEACRSQRHEKKGLGFRIAGDASLQPT